MQVIHHKIKKIKLRKPLSEIYKYEYFSVDKYKTSKHPKMPSLRNISQIIDFSILHNEQHHKTNR